MLRSRLPNLETELISRGTGTSNPSPFSNQSVSAGNAEAVAESPHRQVSSTMFGAARRARTASVSCGKRFTGRAMDAGIAVQDTFG
jgi:hypothetical protein